MKAKKQNNTRKLQKRTKTTSKKVASSKKISVIFDKAWHKYAVAVMVSIVAIAIVVYPHVYNEETNAAQVGQTVVGYARTQINKFVYRRGGCHKLYPISTTDNCGGDDFDCSGLARWAWFKAGYKISYAPDINTNWDTKSMWANRALFYNKSGHTYAALKSYLIPGDVLLFAYNSGHGEVHHAAIYSGNGKFIESTPDGNKKVREIAFTRADAVGFIRPSSRQINCTAPPASYPNITLKRGSSDTCKVLLLQTVLNMKKVGAYNLVRDGDFGSGTESAVKKFQTKYNSTHNPDITVNGIADPATWKAIWAVK